MGVDVFDVKIDGGGADGGSTSRVLVLLVDAPKKPLNGSSLGDLHALTSLLCSLLNSFFDPRHASSQA